jgi:hypothetical protein
MGFLMNFSRVLFSEVRWLEFPRSLADGPMRRTPEGVYAALVVQRGGALVTPSRSTEEEGEEDRLWRRSRPAG